MGFKSMCCLKTTLQPLYQVMLHLNYHNASKKKPIYIYYIVVMETFQIASPTRLPAADGVKLFLMISWPDNIFLCPHRGMKKPPHTDLIKKDLKHRSSQEQRHRQKSDSHWHICIMTFPTRGTTVSGHVTVCHFEIQWIRTIISC